MSPLRSLALPLAAAGSLAAQAAAQTTIYHLEGETDGERFGSAVAYLPDRDGDGRDEILVGVPLDSTAALNAGAVRLVSGANGLVQEVVLGDGADHRLGTDIAAAGDVNADGFVDVIAGAPSECGTGLIGYARVYSGTDMSELHTVHGDTFLDWFGRSVSGAGDQDFDGYADFAVGAHSFCGGFELNGYVRAYSGLTGEERWTANGDGTWDTFGLSLDALGDFDLDGAPDMIVGAPGSDDAGYDAGRFYLISGADGAKIYFENGEAGLHYSGFAVAGIGDADLDGTVDYAIGVPGEQDNFASLSPSPHPSEFGKVQIWSGADHVLLHEYYGPDAFDHLGWSVTSAGDLNADGYPEVAAAAIRWDVQTSLISLGPAYVEVLSSEDGTSVLHIEGPLNDENFHVDMDATGDVNGDGINDIVLGSSGAELTSGLLEIVSGRELEMSSPVHTIPAGAPVEQELLIDAPEEYLGSYFQVLGSFSGTSPGFRLDGLIVPLNMDDYFAYTLDPPKGNILKHSDGILTSKKKKAPQFMPPTDIVVDLAGVTVNHALVIYDETGTAVCVSPPVPVTIVP